MCNRTLYGSRGSCVKSVNVLELKSGLWSLREANLPDLCSLLLITVCTYFCIIKPCLHFAQTCEIPFGTTVLMDSLPRIPIQHTRLKGLHYFSRNLWHPIISVLKTSLVRIQTPHLLRLSLLWKVRPKNSSLQTVWYWHEKLCEVLLCHLKSDQIADIHSGEHSRCWTNSWCIG